MLLNIIWDEGEGGLQGPRSGDVEELRGANRAAHEGDGRQDPLPLRTGSHRESEVRGRGALRRGGVR